MNKQVEERACKNCIHYEVCMYVNAQAVEYARAENCKLFRDTAGYRKQSEGEWVVISKRGLNSKRNRRINYETYTCAVCGRSNGKYKANYCPNCGAKMKGERDEKAD